MKMVVYHRIAQGNVFNKNKLGLSYKRDVFEFNKPRVVEFDCLKIVEFGLICGGKKSSKPPKTTKQLLSLIIEMFSLTLDFIGEVTVFKNFMLALGPLSQLDYGGGIKTFGATVGWFLRTISTKSDLVNPRKIVFDISLTESAKFVVINGEVTELTYGFFTGKFDERVSKLNELINKEYFGNISFDLDIVNKYNSTLNEEKIRVEYSNLIKVRFNDLLKDIKVDLNNLRSIEVDKCKSQLRLKYSGIEKYLVRPIDDFMLSNPEIKNKQVVNSFSNLKSFFKDIRNNFEYDYVLFQSKKDDKIEANDLIHCVVIEDDFLIADAFEISVTPTLVYKSKGEFVKTENPIEIIEIITQSHNFSKNSQDNKVTPL